eukprot:Sdes_comp15754_c0_seq2m4804
MEMDRNFVSKNEVALLVLRYLATDRNFTNSFKQFKRESEFLVKKFSTPSQNVKSLQTILSEYVVLKKKENDRIRCIKNYGVTKTRIEAVNKLFDLLECESQNLQNETTDPSLKQASPSASQSEPPSPPNISSPSHHIASEGSTHQYIWNPRSPLGEISPSSNLLNFQSTDPDF